MEDKNTSDKKADDDEQIMLKILVGNKLDLDNEREVKYEEGEKFSKDNKFSLFTEISCKEDTDKDNNKKIESIIEIIGKEFYKYNDQRERLNSSSYNYEASKSLLDSKNEDKSCHC